LILKLVDAYPNGIFNFKVGIPIVFLKYIIREYNPSLHNFNIATITQI
jgi:hypothetical protein